MYCKRYLIMTTQLCCVITWCASDGDTISNEELSIIKKNLRFADILFELTYDLQVIKNYVGLYQKRVAFERPEVETQEEISLLDNSIQRLYEQKISVDKQLTMNYDKRSDLVTKKENLIVKIDELMKLKQSLERHMEHYGKSFKNLQDTQSDEELQPIMLGSDTKRLDQYTNRIAFMYKETTDLDQQIVPLHITINFLEKEREQLNAHVDDFYNERAKLSRLQVLCADVEVKSLLDLFDELIEHAIAIAHAGPIPIFNRLKQKTDYAEECAWCIALLKIFQSKNPENQRIINHVQHIKSYCDQQAACYLCQRFCRERGLIFNKITDECLQQLKHDKVYRICSVCDDSVLKSENLCKKVAFVDRIAEVVPDYIEFRLDYLKTFQKYDITVNLNAHRPTQSSLIDLFSRYSAHMETLKTLLDDKHDMNYLRNSLKEMRDVYSAFDGFCTKKDLSERVCHLLTISQKKADKVLRDLAQSSCQSSASNSSLNAID